MQSSTTTSSNPQAEEKTRQFAIEAARLAANTRCHNVILLDVRGISPVTDYMVLASGTSARQMRTVCDELAEWAQEQHNTRALNSDGLEGENWMLIDFVDTVVHVFSDSARQFYDLDGLWGDAKRVEFNLTPKAPSDPSKVP
jgi:ribosome-associated protein